MKRFLLFIILSAFTSGIFAQDHVTLFFLKDGSFKGFYDEEIDHIAYSNYDLDSIWHNDAVVQDVWTTDSLVRIPIEDIDSICHRVPDPVYKPGVIRLDERYLPYVSSVDGLTVTFSSALPAALLPHAGDILLYENVSELFPEGFAGKVLTVQGGVVTCERADIPDVYERFVLFGKYVVARQDEQAGANAAYTLRRVPRKVDRKKEEDYGIDNWRMGEVSWKDIEVGTVKFPVKLKFKKIKTEVKVDYSVTPTITIEFAYDMYWRNKMFFLKTCSSFDDELKVAAAVKFKDEYEDPLSKLAPVSPWEPGTEPNFKEISLGDYSSDSGDGDDCQSVYLIDKSFPCPNFPLLKTDFKLGFFMEPKAEAELSIGFTRKGHVEKQFIFRWDKDHDMERQYYQSEPTSETEFFLDATGKLSLWTGIVGSVGISLGVGDELEAREDLRLRVGPYIEGTLKAKIADAIADKSVYSLLKDSKLKTGVKLGVDMAFKANVFGKHYKWEHFSWSPKKLFWERSAYIYPAFTAPEYTTKGNTLTCSSYVSRATMANTIGFAVYDETGTEIARKFQDDEYCYAEKDHPLYISETFDNLDFANHRYTITPTTRPMGVKLFQVDMPDDLCTTVLCPDSHHPHLIDMGLPSGTKWLCSNLYADAPEEAGGYYQWGKPYMSHLYSEATYYPPRILTDHYQGSENDAATVNLGEHYSTPTLAQFRELINNTSYSPRYSTWGETIFGSVEGAYFKAKNGNNLYLPFSGLKTGIKVNGDTKDKGFYVVSDAKDAEGSTIHKDFVITKDGTATVDASWVGSSLRPVSGENSGLSITPQELNFEEVIVGSNSGQYINIMNTGNVPVNITVLQTTPPFSIPEEVLGTFTIAPTELKSILVQFFPTSAEEYNALATIQYEIDNTCTVCKVPLTGKGFDNTPPVTETLELSQYSVTLNDGEYATVEIVSGSGSYTVQSSDVSVLWVKVEGSTITMRGKDSGTASITVTDTETQETATINVEIIATYDETLCPDNQHPHMIDMGNGMKWACCNVGAKKPDGYGSYFAWGEVEEKKDYTWATYKFYNSDNTFQDIGTDIGGTQYDVAYVKWGSAWRMPTVEEFTKLKKGCDGEVCWVNSRKGIKFTSKTTGNAIFIPFDGWYYGTRNTEMVNEFTLWSSTIYDFQSAPYDACILYGSSYWNTWYVDKESVYGNMQCYRCMGRSVRPIAY